MNPLQALIFDVDGTLAETERDGHRPAFNAAFLDCGLDWFWDESLYGELLAVTGGKERMRFYAERYAPEMLALPDFTERIREVHRAKTAHYVRLVAAGGLPLRPGVASLILEARQNGLQLAIATTTAPENVDALLRATLGPEVSHWFQVIGAGDIVPAKKPAPDIYRWVLTQLALPAENCVAIEDSENGLKSALGAGLRCLVTVGEYTRDQDFSGATGVVNNLAETSLAKVTQLITKS